ncbi:MAG: rod shape-determining protein MreD [Elusimicrobia bacterium]|nr:rod shape-determining protein MreD [Elusimicrobiota bacterium]
MAIFLSIIIGFLFQIFIYRYVNISGVSINIMLILTLQISLVAGGNRGMFFGFFSGLLEDLFFPGLLGERALVRLIIAYFVGSLRGRFSPGNVLFQFIVNTSSYLIHFGGIFLIRTIFSLSTPPAVRLVPSALVVGLFAPVFYFIVSRTNAG